MLYTIPHSHTPLHHIHYCTTHTTTSHKHYCVPQPGPPPPAWPCPSEWTPWTCTFNGYMYEWCVIECTLLCCWNFLFSGDMREISATHLKEYTIHHNTMHWTWVHDTLYSNTTYYSRTYDTNCTISLVAVTPQLVSRALSLSKASISEKSALPTPIIMTLIGVLDAATSAACVV